MFDPIAVEFRDAAAATVDAVVSGAMRDQLLGEVANRMIVATESAAAAFGNNLERLQVPDGFFDALNNTGRQLALAGILMALEAGVEDGRWLPQAADEDNS